MSVTEYLQAVERAYGQGNATEHTYRPFLQALVESLAEVTATNEPKRVLCGAPDYIVSRRKDRLTLGYIEAKDVGGDLSETEKTEQLKRYHAHLPNLILTNYLEVRWYVKGDRGVEKRGAATLGRLDSAGRITSDPAETTKALRLIRNFLAQRPVEINTAEDLARRLAHLTHMVRDIIVEAFASGENSQQLRDWRAAFAATLLPELAPQPEDPKKEAEARAEFADMFAQTLAYGLFSARAAGPGGKFTREQARKLIPRTNPFLRHFFEQITGAALEDEPFAGFVDDIIQTLDHAGMDDILRDFGKRGRRSDPVVHFYETFLQAYDPKLRELRGVYYTPEPVVNYIVESLDLVLKNKFGLKDGLADRSQVTVTRTEGEKEIQETSHRVLILDPATGTATFLYRVLDFIREQFERKKKLGAWGDYVHEHLLPRLFGFELLMAPYAVAHFKLGLALAAWDKEPLFRQPWSYEPHKGERINIFLTNTLEDLEKTAEQLGPLRMLSDEANSAYEIKKHKPVLVILGNPPYSGHSANKGEWIRRLVRDYHVCDGKPLGERNPKWLQDDYVKFIRWAQWRIEQTGQGVLGFVTNHGYLDNPTFRGMRQSLISTFDEIYLVDLHGNSKKKEIDPATGAPDKNVFDIQQGVAITIFVKLPSEAKRKKPAIVRHAHLHGSQRAKKYAWLEEHHIENMKWTALQPVSPAYLFIPQDKALFAEYEEGWKVTEMLPVHASTVTTARNDFSMSFETKTLIDRIGSLIDERVSDDKLRQKYNLRDVSYWTLPDARSELRKIDNVASHVRPYCYRPFDDRFVYYHPAVCERLREEVMKHVREDNISLLTHRPQSPPGEFNYVFCTAKIGDQCVAANKSTGGGNTFQFPLYLYRNAKPAHDDLFVREERDEPPRRHNLSAEFIADFCAKLNVKFVPDGLGHPKKREIGPEMIFNYAYAVFHSPGYRQRYAEFLRTDFPRLPITSDYKLFGDLAGFGSTLVGFHARVLDEGKGPGFPVKGDNKVEEMRYQPAQRDGADRHGGRVWINSDQYFEPVPTEAWNLLIGGYQPAERWLKDRRGRILGYEEVTTYARIIHALGETRRLMNEIEASIEGHGGWPAAFAI